MANKANFFKKGNKFEIKKGEKLSLGKVLLTEFRDAIMNICHGDSVAEACRKAGLDSTTFMNLKNREPELEQVYYEALKRRNDLDNERVRNEVLNCDKDSAFPAKIKTEWIKWHSGKMNPKIYGENADRPPVNLEINIGGELVTVKGGKK